jgi:hypothetical protein
VFYNVPDAESWKGRYGRLVGEKDYPTSKRQTAPIWIGGRGSARMARWRSAANDRHTVARLQASARTACDRRAVHECGDLARVVAAVSEAGGVTQPNVDACSPVRPDGLSIARFDEQFPLVCYVILW